MMAAASVQALLCGPWLSWIFLAVSVSASEKGTVGVVCYFTVFVDCKMNDFGVVRGIFWTISCTK